MLNGKAPQFDARMKFDFIQHPPNGRSSKPTQYATKLAGEEDPLRRLVYVVSVSVSASRNL